jgi:hypothetical protein
MHERDVRMIRPYLTPVELWGSFGSMRAEPCYPQLGKLCCDPRDAEQLDRLLFFRNLLRNHRCG